jgi:hypothetical protein
MTNHASAPKAEPNLSSGRADDRTTTNEMAADNHNQYIIIKVCGHVGGKESACFINMSRECRLGRLMDAFCERNNLERKGVTFYLDGQRVVDDETPNQVGREQRSNWFKWSPVAYDETVRDGRPGYHRSRRQRSLRTGSQPNFCDRQRISRCVRG